MIKILRENTFARNAILYFVVILLAAYVLVALGQAPVQASSNVVTRVGDQTIRIADIQNAKSELSSQYAQYQATDEQINNLAAKFVMGNALMAQGALDAGVVVSDAELRDYVIKARTQGDGSYLSGEEYRAAVSRTWGSVENYENHIRENIIRTNKYRMLFQDAVFISEDDVKERYEETNRTLNADLFALNIYAFREESLIKDEELKAFYDGHPEEFMTGPQRKIRYVLYQTSTHAESIQPTPAEIKTYYDANRDKNPYFQQERARVRHILIKNEGRSAEQARELAMSVKASLAGGKTFEELVAAHSEDQVSKGRQGDLGVFTRGQYTASYGDSFDKMVFSLSEGQVSEPFESSQGWHLVRMENHFPELRQSMEEASESIVNVLKNEKGKTQAQAKAAEFHSQVSAGKSFAEVAGALGATLQESDFFDMNNASLISTELGAHIKIKNSVFAAKEKDKGAELLDVGIGFTLFQYMDEREPVKLEFEATNYRIKQAAEQARGRQILRRKVEELAAHLRSEPELSLEDLRKKFPFLNESNARSTNPFGSANMPFQLARTELGFEEIYALEKGAIVGPLSGKENPNDMYLLRLTDKTQPDPVGFEAARSGLLDQLRQERFTDLMESTLLGMKARLDPTGARYAKIQDALLSIK